MEVIKVYKVVIAEDKELIRDCIRKYLEADQEIEVVASVGNGMLAVDACRSNKVDVVLMDMVMPECNGIEATKMIMELDKDIKVLILTAFPDRLKLIEAAKAGASGYLIKDSPAKTMILSIKNAVNGILAFEKGVFDGILNSITEDNKPNSDIFSDLSENEINVLRILAEDGLDNKVIAQKLFLSEGTVKSIISKLMKKYSFNSRTQLALFALKNGLG